MTAPVIDYLNPPPLPKTALTPGSTPHDVDGVVEILRLITDPAALKKRLDELQQAVAAADRRIAEAARREAELRSQVADLARRREEFDRELAVDRRNHIAETEEQKRATAAKLAQYAQLLARHEAALNPQPEATS